MKILFLCVANSARSQMAEGLAREIFGKSAQIESAGSAPKGVHPLAIQAMRERGLDISKQQSKSVNDLELSSFDYVITLCADEICPVVHSKAQRMHWPFEDPAPPTGSDSDNLETFKRVRDQIEQRLIELRTSLTGL